MKVTIETNEEKEQEITFPCLMENIITGNIIIATGLKTQTEYKGFHLKENQFNSDYCVPNWRPLPKGTKVILEN